MAATMIDVISAAGGLAFDRAMSGWDVTVYLAEPHSDPPLQILGAKNADLNCAPRRYSAETWPDSVLVAMDLYRRDERVRRYFTSAARDALMEVAMWGSQWPTALTRGSRPFEHRLSVAAVAFRAHAMRTAGAPRSSSPRVETFHAPKHPFSR